MSRKFKLVLAGAYWTGSKSLQFLYANFNVKLAYVRLDDKCWIAGFYATYTHTERFKSQRAAKAYVIRQLAKPEKMK